MPIPTPPPKQWSRPLSPNEISYYLPSRKDGANDMYLHHTLKTQRIDLFARERIVALWALIIVRHPLLASWVREVDYDDISFVYDEPQTAADALARSTSLTSFTFRNPTHPRPEILNGPRILSSSTLCRLVVSHRPLPPTDEGIPEWEVEVVRMSTHFVGDGAAGHRVMNEFLTLVGDEGLGVEEVGGMIEEVIQARKGSEISPLPISADERIHLSQTRLAQLARKLDYQRTQSKLIGGQVLPRCPPTDPQARDTAVRRFALTVDDSARVVKAGKRQGVSVGPMVIAACNIAWASITKQSVGLPCLMYSAMSLRTALPSPNPYTSYVHLCISYFDIILPSFLPSTLTPLQAFWSRSRMVKKQIGKVVKSEMLLGRSGEMFKAREGKAKAWARRDDGVEEVPEIKEVYGKPPPPPPVALMGVSMLGNLDMIYSVFDETKLFESVDASMGTRQRSGGALLFGYTFRGKLSVLFQYDNTQFETEVMAAFFERVQKVLSSVE